MLISVYAGTWVDVNFSGEVGGGGNSWFDKAMKVCCFVIGESAVSFHPGIKCSCIRMFQA